MFVYFAENVDRAECYTEDDLILVSDDEDSDNENVDVNNIIQTLRHRLKKYLYRPQTKNLSDNLSDELCNVQQRSGVERQGESDSDVAEAQYQYRLRRKRRQKRYSSLPSPDATFIHIFERQKCERCHKSITVHRHHYRNSKRSIQFCQKCKHSMEIGKNSAKRKCMMKKQRLKRSSHRYENVQRRRRQLQQQRQEQKPYLLQTTENRSTEQRTVHNCINIVDKLKQLGTSIHYECYNDEKPQMKRQRIDHGEVMASTPFEIDMFVDPSTKNSIFSCAHKAVNAFEQPNTTTTATTTNHSNEILLTFNTVLTEVFPIQLLYDNDQTTKNVENNAKDCNQTTNFNEILKNVPKSLTITLT